MTEFYKYITGSWIELLLFSLLFVVFSMAASTFISTILKATVYYYFTSKLNYDALRMKQDIQLIQSAGLNVTSEANTVEFPISKDQSN